jgi:hypothetical protein
MEMWLRLAANGHVGMLRSYQAVYRRHEANMSLSYMADGFLPDMRQRKAAVDCFLQTCAGKLRNAEQLQRKLYRTLATDAVRLGSAAFNAGEMKTAETLCEFARLTCPEIPRSLVWAKLACKRRLGHDLWTVVHPAVRVVVSATSLLRHPNQARIDPRSSRSLPEA